MAVPAQLMDLFSQMGQGSTNTRGQLSSYQNNGPLNGLVHVLVADIDQLTVAPHDGSTAAARQDLLNAFAAEHNVYLGWDDLKQALKELTPIQREVVLGPVLRKLIPTKANNTDPITAKEVARLARTFDIKVESYLTPDAFKATKLIPEIKKADIDIAYAMEAHALATRLRVTVATIPALEEKKLRDIIAKRFSGNQAQEWNVAKRAEIEFKRRSALPVGDVDRPDANQIPATIVPAGPAITTLKLWQSDDNQYQFDTPNPAEHNSHYASHPFASYEKQSADVKAVVEKVVAERQAGKPVKLKQGFQQFYLEQSKKPGALADEMQNQMQTMLSGLTNTLGFGDKNGIVGFIGKIISGLLPGVFQLFSSLSNMKSMFSNMGKTADSPVDGVEEMKELKEKNPELAVETKEFAGLVRKLEEQGDTGAIEARRLNEAWRAAPNTPAVWKDLAVTMIDHGLNDDVDSWMRAKAKNALSHLIREEKRISPNALTPLHTELNRIRTAFDTLEDPKLANASDAYKAENLELRLRMFERLMQVATNVSTKQDDYKKTAESAENLRQQAAGLNRSHVAAQAAGTPVTPTLQERLTKVRRELGVQERECPKKQEALRREIDTSINGPIPGILHMAQAHAGRKAEALRAVAIEQLRRPGQHNQTRRRSVY